MQSVKIDDLAKQLGSILKRVREGEEIVIRDGPHPVARLVPLTSRAEYVAEEEALVREGRLRAPQGILPNSFWTITRPRLSLALAIGAVDAGRQLGG